MKKELALCVEKERKTHIWGTGSDSAKKKKEGRRRTERDRVGRKTAMNIRVIEEGPEGTRRNVGRGRKILENFVKKNRSNGRDANSKRGGFRVPRTMAKGG